MGFSLKSVRFIFAVNNLFTISFCTFSHWINGYFSRFFGCFKPFLGFSRLFYILYSACQITATEYFGKFRTNWAGNGLIVCSHFILSEPDICRRFRRYAQRRFLPPWSMPSTMLRTLVFGGNRRSASLSRELFFLPAECTGASCGSVEDSTHIAKISGSSPFRMMSRSAAAECFSRNSTVS